MNEEINKSEGPQKVRILSWWPLYDFWKEKTTKKIQLCSVTLWNVNGKRSIYLSAHFFVSINYFFFFFFFFWQKKKKK